MPSSSPFSIRPATRRDAHKVAELHAQAMRDAGLEAEASGRAQAMSVIERQAYWREAIEFSEPQVRVAIEGTGDAAPIVGFVGFDRSRDDGTPPTTGEIWALCVVPEHQDKGIGQALCEAALQGLSDEDCTDATLWLTVDNERALSFFEQAGFAREDGSLRAVAGVDGKQEVRLHRALG